MKGLLPYTLQTCGKLIDLSEPQVMGILNVTPDSFYAESRQQTDDAIRQRASQILSEGGSMIDVGAYSSRPGADEVSPQEEWARLDRALSLIRNEHPEAIISVDTFRADVAKRCVDTYGVNIINDISGGELDKDMFDTVAELGVPYILMHMKGTPQTMQITPHYDHLLPEVITYFAKRVDALRARGVKDIILDPGFGFAKTLDHNYELMNHMEMLQILNLPILVGISRKSMIYKLLGCTPQESLGGTTVLHTMCLLKGASILRVHDVAEAVACTKIVQKTLEQL